VRNSFGLLRRGMGASSVASPYGRRVTTFLLVDPWPLRDEEAPPITGNMRPCAAVSASAYVPLWAVSFSRVPGGGRPPSSACHKVSWAVESAVGVAAQGDSGFGDGVDVGGVSARHVAKAAVINRWGETARP